ncbi:MAG: hypothetical protein M0P57_07365 [Syntrophales bacterium]|jgi:hypothetical protein|nr:hypothetical protein [Syntrophales bacterium]MDY0043038.1 hypothetical protein [Syntrophales bacterium]
MKKNEPGESGRKLAALIDKAIEDGELTTTEYDRILALADRDGVIDSQERQLLKTLNDMLENKTIKKVPG